MQDDKSASPRPLVLIHGAWHGGWCWEPTVEKVQALQPGLDIHTPTLLGLGDRAEFLTPELSLQDQIADIANYIDSRDLRNMVLVGHSYGGLIITGLADRLASRVDHLVYLDALVPISGESMATSGSLPLKSGELQSIRDRFAAIAPDGLAMTPPPPTLFGVPQEHPAYDWVAANLTPHPLKPCFDELILTTAQQTSIPRTYIACVKPPLKQSGVAAGAKRAKEQPGWTYLEIETGHDAMITAPGELAEILVAHA